MRWIQFYSAQSTAQQGSSFFGYSIYPHGEQHNIYTSSHSQVTLSSSSDNTVNRSRKSSQSRYQAASALASSMTKNLEGHWVQRVYLEGQTRPWPPLFRNEGGAGKYPSAPSAGTQRSERTQRRLHRGNHQSQWWQRVLLRRISFEEPSL